MGNENNICFSLKEYYDEGRAELILPGQIVDSIPKGVDQRDLLYYTSKKEYDKNLIPDLILVAETRNDIRFKDYQAKISLKNIKMLNSIQRENNYNQGFLSRYINKDLCTVSAMVTTSTNSYVARKIIRTTKYRDDIPFLLLSQILGYIRREIVSIELDVLNLGYMVEPDEVHQSLRDIRYCLPNRKTTTSPQLFQLFNHYLKTGDLLIPGIDLSEIL